MKAFDTEPEEIENIIKQIGGYVGHDTKKLQNLAIKVDAILKQELKKENMKYEFAEARMFNIRSVGVQGDASSYKYPAEITIKHPRHQDGTKYSEKEYYSFIGRLSSRVTNEINEINRVVWVIGTEEEGFEEWV